MKKAFDMLIVSFFQRFPVPALRVWKIGTPLPLVDYPFGTINENLLRDNYEKERVVNLSGEEFTRFRYRIESIRLDPYDGTVTYLVTPVTPPRVYDISQD